MKTTTLNIPELVEETLATLYRATERPRETTVGATALSSGTDTSMTVADPDIVSRTHLLEFEDGEQVKVSAKSDTDVLTVSRGYNNTPATAGGHATGDRVLINPTWGYLEVDRWVRRFFDTVGNTYLPLVTTEAMYREPGLQYVTLPDAVDEVVQVRAESIDGRFVDVAGWQQEKYLPAEVVATGHALRVSRLIGDDDELLVTYTGVYDTSADDIVFPVGASDLPVLWASAYAVGRREVSRVDLDTIEEWNQAAAIRNGQNLRLLRELWGEFYRRLDEARKLQEVPKHRPFRKMPRIR